MEKILLRESKAPYTLLLEEQTFQHETMIVEPNGQAVAILLPATEYQEFRAWQVSQQRQANGKPGSTAFEQEKATFAEMLPTLLQTHLGHVVAVYGQQVVEVGDEFSDVIEKVYRRFGYVPCYVQRVEKQPRVYKTPHRKVIR